MLLTILAAAAVAAVPLPEGRGGRPTPLAITSDVPGAEALAAFRERDGSLGLARCFAPCTLQIPANSPLVVRVKAPDGTFLKTPELRWKPGGLLKIPYSEELSPSTINATR